MISEQLTTFIVIGSKLTELFSRGSRFIDCNVLKIWESQNSQVNRLSHFVLAFLHSIRNGKNIRPF